MSKPQRERSAVQASGGTAKREFVDDVQSPPPPRKVEGARSGGRGKVTSRIHDRIEVYAYVTESDLREAVEFGVLQQVLVQVGTFFFAGAFWLLIELIIKQSESSAKFTITPWMTMCTLSIVFGAMLWVAGWAIFRMKQKKLKRYFPKNGAST